MSGVLKGRSGLGKAGRSASGNIPGGRDGKSAALIPVGAGRAEALVGFGFRYWMAGYQSSEFDYWTRGWQLYTDELGVHAARPLITDLAAFVQEVHTTAKRPIEVENSCDARFCRDECEAMNLIAVCQKGMCPALEACAVALIGEDNTERLICTSCNFANRLADQDLFLSEDCVAKLTAETVAGAP